MEENTNITQDIASMKMTLMKLQTERLKAGGKATHEVDAALAKVALQARCVASLLFRLLTLAVRRVHEVSFQAASVVSVTHWHTLYPAVLRCVVSPALQQQGPQGTLA